MKKITLFVSVVLLTSCNITNDVDWTYIKKHPRSIKVLTIEGDTARILDLGNTYPQIEIINK